MIGIAYYWEVTLNYDTFTNVEVYIFSDMNHFKILIHEIDKLNKDFQNLLEIKTGEKYKLGNYLTFKDESKYKIYNNCYFLVTYNKYYCNLELYTITNIYIDISNLIEYLSKIKINNVIEPCIGKFLEENYTFMNDDNYCLYHTTKLYY
jgi:hypothetical protein